MTEALLLLYMLVNAFACCSGAMCEVPEKYELARKAIESGLWPRIELGLPYRASAGANGRFDVMTF